MRTALQKRPAQAVVDIFETGRVQGEYGQVTLLRNDSGHLTYGRAQTTLASGNLSLLITAYTDSAGAQGHLGYASGSHVLQGHTGVTAHAHVGDHGAAPDWRELAGGRGTERARHVFARPR